MKSYIFFDTETTCFVEDYGKSVRPDEDILIQLAYIIITPDNQQIVKERICKNSGFPLVPKAMSVHNIVPEMIEGLEPITAYPEYSFLKDYIKNNECIAIAHNASFDIDVLKRVDIDIEKYCDVIDTLICARVINDSLGLPFHSSSLQHLKYEHALYNKRPKLDEKLGITVGNAAHNAMSDIADLMLYFNYFKKEYGATDEQMIELTFSPNLLKYVPSGSNKGKEWSELSRNSLKWYAENMSDRDISYSAKYYLSN